MTTKNDFLKAVAVQVDLNRMMHGEKRRPMSDWAMIAQEHMGHLFGAILSEKTDEVEKELLHVVAPLLELYQEIKGGYKWQE